MCCGTSNDSIVVPGNPFFLPSAFWLISGSDFGATPHDDAHDDFMTLPGHTSTREDEMQPEEISPANILLDRRGKKQCLFTSNST
jgi:hypothetical protein